MIPVGDIFALKKASLVQDELLADVDERFIQEIQRNKDNINKYKGMLAGVLRLWHVSMHAYRLCIYSNRFIFAPFF